MVLIVVVALAVPHFGVVLNLVGATTIAVSNFVFPPLFYLLLSRQKSRSDGYIANGDVNTTANDEEKLLTSQDSGNFPYLPSDDNDARWENFEVPFHEKVIFIEIMLIGIVGGIASVYSAILVLVDGSSGFTAPCFSDWAAADV